MVKYLHGLSLGWTEGSRELSLIDQFSAGHWLIAVPSVISFGAAFISHFGHKNEQVHYVMDGNMLESVEEERD